MVALSQPPVEQLHEALATLAGCYAAFEFIAGNAEPDVLRKFSDTSNNGALTPSTCAFLAADALEMALDLGVPTDRKAIEEQVLRLRGLANAFLAREQAGAR
jgi:hypothetical protein